MGVWKKSPRADSNLISRLQARVNADPVVQQFRSGYGSPNDPWRRSQGGRLSDPDQLKQYVRQILGADLPDGYDVSQDGEIVYTNKTPFLKQAAWASLPIAGPMAAEAFMGGAGAAGAAGGSGGAAGGAAAGGMPFYVPGMGQALPGALAAENALLGAPQFASLMGAGYKMAPNIAGAAGGAGGVMRNVINDGGGAAGKSLLSRILTGLKDYAPLIPAGIAATRGLTQRQTPAETQLGNMLGIAEGRIKQAQPLYDELMSLGADDANLVRSRRQSADPLFQALMTMANSGLPDYARRG